MEEEKVYRIINISTGRPRLVNKKIYEDTNLLNQMGFMQQDHEDESNLDEIPLIHIEETTLVDEEIKMEVFIEEESNLDDALEKADETINLSAENEPVQEEQKKKAGRPSNQNK
jgi:hypothetical protein